MALSHACGQFLGTWLRPDRYEDDAIQHVWWLNRFAEPGLFPNDLVASYYSSRVLAPSGYVAIFRSLLPLVRCDAQTLSETIPFALTVPLALLAFALSRRAARGSMLGGTIGALFLTWYGLHHLRGGFARSFDLPILLLGLWALSPRRLAWLGAALLLAALVYPPTLINLGPCAALVLGVRWFKERRLPRGWVALVVSGVLALGVTAASYLRPPEWIGKPPTAAQARVMAEYQPGGRLAFFRASALDFYLKDRPSGIGWEPGYALTLVVLLGLTVALFPRAIPLEAWALLGTSLLAFAAAHLLLFKLYFPNRYTLYALDLFLMLWLAAVTGAVVERFRGRPWLERLAHPAVCGVAAAVVVALAVAQDASSFRREMRRPPHWDLGSGTEQVAAFLRTLPRDALVAAHPFDADHVPMRTRRSVLVGSETCVPMHMGYYAMAAERLDASLAACYATDWSDVDALHDRYGVTAFVVNRARYDDPKSLAYVPPFRGDNLRRVERGRQHGFALLDPPPERVLFRAGDFTVVRVGAARDAPQPRPAHAASADEPTGAGRP